MLLLTKVCQDTAHLDLSDRVHTILDEDTEAILLGRTVSAGRGIARGTGERDTSDCGIVLSFGEESLADELPRKDAFLGINTCRARTWVSSIAAQTEGKLVVGTREALGEVELLRSGDA